MSNPNENNELDDLFTSDDGQEDIFSSGGEPGTDDVFASSDDGQEDIFAMDGEVDFTSSDDGQEDVFAMDGELELDVAPSSTLDDSSPFGISDSIPYSEALAEIEAGKGGKAAKKGKGKKAKTEKAAKEPKGAKKPKEKAEKGEIADKAAANAVYTLGIALLVAILLGNVAAFVIAGFGSLPFLILFDILALIVLLVPYLMLNSLRKGPLSLFDAALAIAAISMIVACMVLLSYKAKTFGTSIKAASNAPTAVERFDC